MRLSIYAFALLAALLPSSVLADYTLKPNKIAVIALGSIPCVRSQSAAMNMAKAMHDHDKPALENALVGSRLLQNGDPVQALRVTGVFVQVQYLTVRNGGASGRCWLPNFPEVFRKSKYAPSSM